jgi:heat shock protein HslJ
MSFNRYAQKAAGMKMLLALLVVVLQGMPGTNSSAAAMDRDAAAQPELKGQTWYLQEFNHSDEDCRDKGYLLKFINDTIAECAMPCNTATFRYASMGASMTFTSRGTSLLPCTVTREFEFESAMKQVKRMIAAGKVVYLLDDTDTLLTFINSPKPLLSRTSWVLEELNHSSDNIAGYWLTFSNDTLAKTHMSCNSCSYRYTVNEKSIAFAGGICTEVACMPPNRESPFETALRQVTRWRQSNFRLLLMDSTDTLMSCIDSAVYALLQQPWLLHSFKRDSSLIKIDTPEKYALTFLADGTIRVVADCNTCTGSYSVYNGISQLYMSQFACTKVLCGPESQDLAYLSLLKEVNGCRIRSDTLICYTPPGGTLWFTGPTASIGPSRSPKSVTVRSGGIKLYRIRNAMAIESNIGAIAAIRLINARGVCVRASENMAGNRAVVGTTGLPAGVYMVRVATGNGARVTRSMYLGGK